MSPRWLAWAQQLQAIAQNGLTFATNGYDIERYQAVRRIAAEIAAEHTALARETVLDLFAGEAGYATPKVDVRAAVFRADQLLLVQERTDGLWSLPGGWADVGDAPSAAVEREVFEETGYRARAVKLALVYDHRRHGHPPYPFHVYKFFFLCELIGGTPTATAETMGVGFFAADALPPLSLTRVTAEEIGRLYEHYRQPDRPTDFD